MPTHKLVYFNTKIPLPAAKDLGSGFLNKKWAYLENTRKAHLPLIQKEKAELTVTRLSWFRYGTLDPWLCVLAFQQVCRLSYAIV